MRNDLNFNVQFCPLQKLKTLNLILFNPHSESPAPLFYRLVHNPLFINGIYILLEATSVESVAAAEGEVVATAYYNLQGVRVMNPSAGQILVKVSTLSNGQIRASKITVK